MGVGGVNAARAQLRNVLDMGKGANITVRVFLSEGFVGTGQSVDYRTEFTAVAPAGSRDFTQRRAWEL